MLLENTETNHHFLNLVKIVSAEDIALGAVNIPGSNSTPKASVFGQTDVTTKTQMLEKIVRQKYTDGLIDGRKSGNDNFYYHLASD